MKIVLITAGIILALFVVWLLLSLLYIKFKGWYMSKHIIPVILRHSRKRMRNQPSEYPLSREFFDACLPHMKTWQIFPAFIYPDRSALLTSHLGAIIRWVENNEGYKQNTKSLKNNIRQNLGQMNVLQDIDIQACSSEDFTQQDRKKLFELLINSATWASTEFQAILDLKTDDESDYYDAMRVVHRACLLFGIPLHKNTVKRANKMLFSGDDPHEMDSDIAISSYQELDMFEARLRKATQDAEQTIPQPVEVRR